MSIYLYSGIPGSGKSLHATRTIKDYLKIKKGLVISNYKVVCDGRWKGTFKFCENNELLPSSLVLWAADWWNDHQFKEDGILLVIDECQLIFNSRTWNDHDRLEWIKFFSQHRKYGYKVLFIAQSDQMIDKQIRAVLEYDVTHRKLASIGLIGWITKFLTFSTWFLAITRYYAINEVIDREWFRYSKKLAKMYNSYDVFDNGKALEVRSTSSAYALPENSSFDTYARI